MALGLGAGMPFGSANPPQYQNNVAFLSAGIVTLPAWLTFACASVRTAQVSSSTMLTGVAANQPVVNIYGLQHEPSATNVAFPSADFTAWASSGGTLNSTTVLDPAGTTTGVDHSMTDTSYGGHFLYGTVVISTSHTVSIWVKSADETSKSAFSAGRLTGVAIPTAWVVEPAPVGASWHRSSATYIDVSVSTIYVSINDNRIPGCVLPARSMFAFVQLEATPYVTSYIPTTVSAVTRLASTLKCAGVTDNFEMSITWIAATSSVNTPRSAVIVNAGSTQSVGFEAGGGFRSVRGAEIFTGAVLPVWSAGSTLKLDVVISGMTSKMTLSVNGTVVATETFTHTTSWVSGASVALMSNNSGAEHTPKHGIKSIGWSPL